MLTRVACFAILLLPLPAVSIAASWWPFSSRPSPSEVEKARQGRLETIQRAFRTDFATLSRDGRHLAYSVIEGQYGRIEVVGVDDRAFRQTVPLGDLGGARMLALEWTSAEKLVVALESGALVAIDLGRASPRLLLDPALFAYDATDYSAAFLEAGDDDSPPADVEEHLISRWPRLLHVAPGEDDIVFVEGVGGSGLKDAFAETVRLDVRTGRWQQVDTARIGSTAIRIHTDRQGRPRLIEDRQRLPLRWRVRTDPTRRMRAWQPLDRVIAPELLGGFEAPREGLLDERSFPLAFDVDPNLLYFASNVGRETFGVYLLDLTSGRRTAFALEDADLDLARPHRDFPSLDSGIYSRRLRASNAAARYTDATMEPPSTPLVFDRATGGLVGLRIDDPLRGDRWIDPALSVAQTEMAALFPERRVRLIDWDDARDRMLALVDSAGDPGRFFVYRRSTGKCIEYLRRAPWLTTERRHPVTVFTFSTQDGRSVQGRLTLPLAPVVSPAPIMCLFSDGPWQEAPAGFNRTSQTLAELGCMVLEIDPGLANGRRRAAAPLMRVSPDRVVLDDLMAALDWVAQHHAINRGRVAAFGIGYGGWLALRAAEQRPEAFRCVVSLNGIDTPFRLFDRPREPDLPDGTPRGFQLARDMSDYMAAIKSDFEETEGAPGTSRLRIAERMMSQMEIEPVNLPAEMSRWYFEPARKNADALSVLTHASQLQCPVFLAFDANGPPALANDARRLRRQLERAKNPPELWEAPPADWNRTLAERPEVWQRIDAFLQEKLYRYDVDIGEAKEVEP